ncbi:MAG TPA: hypothetical protein VKE40_14545 [Gemmataceae bacterium]|nr:hypothetical protein [Gemmataceae bacterium]
MSQILPPRTVAAMLDRARDGIHFCAGVDVPLLVTSHESLRAILGRLLASLLPDEHADARLGGDLAQTVAAAEAEARRLAGAASAQKEELATWARDLVRPAATPAEPTGDGATTALALAE